MRTEHTHTHTHIHNTIRTAVDEPADGVLVAEGGGVVVLRAHIDNRRAVLWWEVALGEVQAQPVEHGSTGVGGREGGKVRWRG